MARIAETASSMAPSSRLDSPSGAIRAAITAVTTTASTSAAVNTTAIGPGPTARLNHTNSGATNSAT